MGDLVKARKVMKESEEKKKNIRDTGNSKTKKLKKFLYKYVIYEGHEI